MGHFLGQEGARLNAIYRYRVLDTPKEVDFDDFTELAAQICETPVALISIVEKERQWFKAEKGLGCRETPLSVSFCKFAIDQDAFLEIPDTKDDPRVQGLENVTRDGGIRFYAGALLRTPEGVAIGTLCVIDYEPRTLTTRQRDALAMLANKVVAALELRLAREELEVTLTARDSALERLDWEASMLAKVAEGHALNCILEDIALGVDQLSGGARSSILLVRDGRLWHGAAPHLPAEFNALVHGLVIGPGVGSCGTAAWRKEPVVVKSIATDPLWTDFKFVVEQFDLHACLSRPIFGESGEVVATFALYWSHECEPTRELQTLIDRASDLVRITLQRHLRERQIKESEEKFRSTFRDAASPMAVASLDGMYLEANRAYCEMVGYEVEELSKLNVLGLTHPDDRSMSDEGMKDLVAGNRENYTIEKRFVNRDGTSVWARVSVSCLRDYDQKPKSLVAVVQNITPERKAAALLEDQASLMRIAGSLARVGGWAYDPATEALFWSESIHSLVGYSGEPPKLRDVLKRYHPSDQATLKNAMARCLEEGEPFDLELRAQAWDGRWMHARLLGEAVRDGDGKIIKINGAFADVTEAQTLAERLSRTLESISDAFLTLDSEWKVTFMNSEAERLLQKTRDELLGKSVWADFPEAVGGPSYNAYQRVLDTNKAERFEEYLGAIDKWLEISAHPSAEGVAVYFRDVTESRAQRERLREQAELLDRAQDAILVRDLEHNVTYWNRSAELLYGWTAEEIATQKIFSAIYADPAQFFEATASVLSRGEWVGDLEQVDKDGNKIDIEGRWNLVRDDEGKPKAILAINTNITDRKRLEKQFMRAQRLETVGTLAGGIAHDLNNVLTPILMSISMLEEDEADPSRATNLGVIRTSAQRGADMVRQLLAFARGVDGEKRTVQPVEVIDEIMLMMKESFPKNIDLVLDIEESLWDIEADPTQIHQLMTNLCVNARDAMTNGGTLTVRAKQAVLDDVYVGMNPDAGIGAYVILEVEDTGVGMSQETMDRVFEPFFTTKALGKGTGLGLSTVHAIVRNHRGFLRVYSEVKRGTTFKVFLPALESSSAGTTDTKPELPRGRGETILVVDDEAPIRNVAKNTLEHYGYNVLCASNGAEAVSIYAVNGKDISLVLTDMAMPIMDGPTTVVALKSINPDVRVICSSGLDSGNSRSIAFEAGVRHFLAKPYTADTLLVMIRQVLEIS